MIVYLARDIPPLVIYCVNGKHRSSLVIESTDSMITVHFYKYAEKHHDNFGEWVESMGVASGHR